MRRIDTASSATSAPTIPSQQTIKFWQDTVPTGGTIVPAWWLHQLDLEIENLILDGGLTPSNTVHTQIRDAVRVIAAAAISSSNLPGASIIKNNFTISANGDILLTAYDTEEYKDAGITTSLTNGEIEIDTNGRYLVIGGILDLQTANQSSTIIKLFKNGTLVPHAAGGQYTGGVIGTGGDGAGSPFGNTFSKFINLVDNDKLTLKINVDSAATGGESFQDVNGGAMLQVQKVLTS